MEMFTGSLLLDAVPVPGSLTGVCLCYTIKIHPSKVETANMLSFGHIPILAARKQRQFSWPLTCSHRLGILQSQ